MPSSLVRPTACRVEATCSTVPTNGAYTVLPVGSMLQPGPRMPCAKVSSGMSACASTYAAQIITQAASAGFDKPITAGGTWESSVILDAQKGTSVQVYCSTFFDENDDSGAAKEFVAGFKEWLNADSQKLTNNGGNDIVAAVSALGYDAYMTALEAIKAAGSTDGTAIKDALFGVDYDGVTGSITFDQTTGDANKDMAYIKKADNGAFAFVKTQSVEG